MPEMNKICLHKNKQGESCILFPKFKWHGISPQKIYGICPLCGKMIEFTREQYKEERSGRY